MQAGICCGRNRNGETQEKPAQGHPAPGYFCECQLKLPFLSQVSVIVSFIVFTVMPKTFWHILNCVVAVPPLRVVFMIYKKSTRIPWMQVDMLSNRSP